MITAILLSICFAPPNIWEVCIVVHSQPEEKTQPAPTKPVQPQPDRGQAVGSQRPEAPQDDGLLPQQVQADAQTPARRLVVPFRLRCRPFG